MNQKEIWRDVKNFEGLYQVSNLGRVKSLVRYRVPRERVLKGGLGKDGYLHVIFCKDKKQKSINIHKLVAIAFLDHEPCGHEIVVDHIDNDCTNNRLENLRLISQRENCSKDKKGYSSKYVGVCWDKSRNKWMAQIKINGKKKHLGRFTNELEAHNTYQKELKQINK